ncbi:GNAT family N-acetyltransferase [Aquimarina sp. 2201CG5-10]|uniref:GNAT family N-acetyltransferase n=1 Tax=Aquimarina callyspongiae TaxID=3098150 RepID=UPI002AB48741|nr:GNAT family N-acetyltransferase [Aquimarina sp. 2201CG5-10]MDY8135292.1 GNAT family N-acetyltransferase [Aquimarina sp. 2201CG5-10]
MEIELIKAQDTDKDFLLRLRKLTMVEHLEKAGLYLSDEEHIQRIKKYFECSRIILYLTKKAGLIKYLETDDTIEILQLQVLPEYQGKGIGKHLLNELYTKARGREKKLTLKVLKDNPAKHLYERTGFKVIGEDDYEYYMKLS